MTSSPALNRIGAPILPAIARLAAPGVVLALFQTLVSIADTHFVGRLGTDALAGLALVFPLVMLLQMTSAGAMGGGVSSAVARALGAGNEAAARNLVAHALVIALGAGLLYTVLMVGLGRALYTLLRGSGAALTQALAYSDVLYLQIVAPFYPLFGAGMALYFASQGAGHVAWPVLAGPCDF